MKYMLLEKKNIYIYIYIYIFIYIYIEEPTKTTPKYLHIKNVF